MDPVTYKRAVEIHTHRRLAEHESAHAAAALVQGLDVSEVRAPFWTVEAAAEGSPDDAAGYAMMERRRDPDGLRKLAIAVLAGRMENGTAGWPPRWPLTLVPDHGDPTDLSELVKALELDQAGYNALVADAYEVLTSRPYERAQAVIGELLERHGHLDQHTLERVKAIAIEGAKVEHITLKAVTTVSTDQGVFEAVISTESVDREKDIVSAAGMVAALRKWNRPIPLAWNHRSDAADIFGHVYPETVREVAGEVVAGGQVHLDSDVGREAWRSFKSRAVGFSFGYLVPDRGSTPRPGGGRHITVLDVFEITATPTPMNNDTRVLNTKALDVVDLADEYTRQDLEPVRREWADLMTKAMGGHAPAESLRAKSERVAREHAPITVAEFPC